MSWRIVYLGTEDKSVGGVILPASFSVAKNSKFFCGMK